MAYLPVEIVRDIVEMAADHADFATGTKLDGLSRTVRQWVGPVLFQNVILHDPLSAIGFSERLRRAPSHTADSPPTHSVIRDKKFYANTVKFLSITNAKTPYHILENIFEVCSGVSILELDNFYVELSLPHVQVAMRPQQLIWPALFATTSAIDTFENVTHIWFTLRQDAFPDWPRNLKCLALPIRPIDLAEDPQQQWIVDILNLPKMSLLVLNVLPRYQYLSASQDDSVPMKAAEIWDRYLKDVRDSRVMVRNVNANIEDLSVFRQTGESLWTRAQSLGIRHPKFR
jgi:hypothetical protein